MAGDVALLKRIAEFFREDYGKIFSRLRQAVGVCNPTAVEHEAHSLKGLVAHFSAEAASGPLIRLEQMGALGDLILAADAVDELECELARLDAELTPQLAGF